MPSFTDFLLFMLAWFILAIFVVALLNVVKWQYGKSYATTVNRYYNPTLILNYLAYDVEETERIFAVDNTGEVVLSYERPYWAPLDPTDDVYFTPGDHRHTFDTVITVSDNEDHDLFRKTNS